MPRLFGALVVFVCSAAVLMLEILAGRLLAPYVGVTLETYTAIIGSVLAAIAVGAWGGGWLADRVDARRLVGPGIMLGGVLALVAVPAVRAFGNTSTQPGTGGTVFLAMVGFFPPAVVLSSVTPMVAKLRLHDLDKTGRVIGGLSGIGTFGALVGTFVTGFVLVAAVPTRALLFAIAGSLLLLGLAVWWWLSRRDVPVLLLLVGLAVVGAAAHASVGEPCDRQSPYFCIRVGSVPGRPGARILRLDAALNSYVDLTDPTYLGFRYVRSFVDVVAVAWPGAVPLDALHLGGGGFTMPRYLAATRPGSNSTVLELDQAVLDTAREKLGLVTSRSLRVRLGDARVLIRERLGASADLVVGDAFNSLTVPWHLTTREFLREIDRVLRPDGVYVMNVIDGPPFRFARAELATLRERFEWVAAVAPPNVFTNSTADNVVLVASHRPLDRAAIEARTGSRGDQLVVGAALTRFINRASVLTDDFAPIDQWLTRARV